MASIVSRNGARTIHRGCGDDQIVRTNHRSGDLQQSPEPCVLVSNLFSVGDDRENIENSAEIVLSMKPVRRGGSFHSVPEFRHGDGGQSEVIVRMRGEPSGKIQVSPLASNDNVRIKNYFHLDAGLRSDLRAVRRSRLHAAASAGARLTWERAAASSAPLRRSFSAGTRRATGKPFFTRMNEALW